MQAGKIPAVDVVRTVDDQLVEDAGEQFVQHVGATGQQAMQVPALRHPPASGKGGGQRIALHHRDRFEELAERTRGQQARDARSQNHRMIADLGHGPPPLLSVHLTKVMVTVGGGRRQRSRLRQSIADDACAQLK